ncbi:MAG TPA: hypothetical protein VMV15_11170 [Candidatus Binataceae bacterium]|nr:hypothetical protein [Candidatus Binataceae bacterium]
MSLKDDIDAIRAASADRLSPEIRAVMKRGIDDLRASGLAERALKAGDRAPEFQLPNHNGVLVSSAALIAQGPLAISFYRGKW